MCCIKLAIHFLFNTYFNSAKSLRLVAKDKLISDLNLINENQIQCKLIIANYSLKLRDNWIVNTLVLTMIFILFYLFIFFLFIILLIKYNTFVTRNITTVNKKTTQQ